MSGEPRSRARDGNRRGWTESVPLELVVRLRSLRPRVAQRRRTPRRSPRRVARGRRRRLLARIRSTRQTGRRPGLRCRWDRWRRARQLVTLRGGAGNDRLLSVARGGFVDGEVGNDVELGGDGPDSFAAEPGADLFRGGGGQ